MIALSGSSENQNIKVNQLKFHALKLAQERLYLLHWVPRWANDLPHRTCIRLDARGLMDNDIITVKLDNYIIKVWKIENVLSAMQLTPQLATLKRLCFSIKLSTPDFHCKLFLPRKFWRALVCFVNSRNDPTRAPSRSLAGEVARFASTHVRTCRQRCRILFSVKKPSNNEMWYFPATCPVKAVNSA